ncbi:MAG: LysR family transcriptional regulator [Bdellovibrionales bacterium]|nr:LysR family transcriptional regulator [Bdellovibrionales bacterium]
MLERLQTLIEFERLGSTAAVADTLRITQPSVSKRLSQLEAELDLPLFEKVGRNLVLTDSARALVNRCKPLISELKSLTHEIKQTTTTNKSLQIGVSDSLLGSWGAMAFQKIQKLRPEVSLYLHAHRGPRVVSLVRSGDYQVGMVAGQLKASSDLVELSARKEEMVLVGAKDGSSSLIASEESSLTWNEIGQQVINQGYRVEQRLESFFAVAQMAQARMGAGLVPRGVAEALRLKNTEIKSLRPKVNRTVKLIARKTILLDPVVRDWSSDLIKLSNTL